MLGPSVSHSLRYLRRMNPPTVPAARRASWRTVMLAPDLRRLAAWRRRGKRSQPRPATPALDALGAEPMPPALLPYVGTEKRPLAA